MRDFSKLLIFIISFALLSGIHHDAQEKKEEFKSLVTVDYRLIDVVVLNDDDENIVGLNKNNFKLWQNGVEQEMLSLDEVNYLKTDRISPAESKINYDHEIRQRTAILDGQPIWHVILLANVPNDLKRLEKLEDGIYDFIENNLKPRDRMGIFLLTTDSIQIVLGFTGEKDRLLSTVTRLFQNRHLLTPEMAFLYSMSQFAVIKNLNNFVNQLGNLGGRKNIMLLSAGIPDFLGAEQIRHNAAVPGGSDTKASYSLDGMRYTSNLKKDLNSEISKLALALSNTNTSLDVVDLSARKILGTENALSGSVALKKDSANQSDIVNYYKFSEELNSEISPRVTVSDEERLKLLRDIVEVSGGDVLLYSLYSSGKLRDQMEKIYNRNSHYYVLGYIPQNIPTTLGSESDIQELRVEVLNEDVSRVIHKKFTSAPVK